MKNISSCCLVLFTGQVLPTTVPSSGIQLKGWGPFMKELGRTSKVTKKEADQVKGREAELIGKALFANNMKPFHFSHRRWGKKMNGN